MGYYETYVRAVVTRVEPLSPSLVRVRLGGDDLQGWSSSGVADERFVVVFPPPGGREAPAPVRLPDGTQDYPDEATRPAMRSYTVRGWDAPAGEVVVDLVRHGAGVAADWAGRARPGDVVWVTGATGWYEPPADTAWQLLVADLAGLPALARIVESLPGGTRVRVLAEVVEPGDRLPLAGPAAPEVRWLVGSGNGRTPSALPAAVRAAEWPEGPGYVWFAGEAAASRAVRRHLRHERGLPSRRYRSLGYWREDSEAWTARYVRVGPGLEKVYSEAVARGCSSEDALELYDDALERAGL